MSKFQSSGQANTLEFSPFEVAEFAPGRALFHATSGAIVSSISSSGVFVGQKGGDHYLRASEIGITLPEEAERVTLFF